LRAKLSVVYNLEEWLLLRWRYEMRAARDIFPQGHDFTPQALLRGGCLNGRVGTRSLFWRQVPKPGIEKHGHDRGSPDIQMGDGNRTI
jgi:hypothetical protein